MIRRALALIVLAASLLAPFTAFAQAPPPIPALPDSERRVTFTVGALQCPCALNFQIYGDNNDVDNWIQVWLNGVRVLSTDPTFGWSLSSGTGPLLLIPRPITDAVLTFNNPQTGTVQVIGAQRPRRLVTFSESQGVTARSFNQAFNTIFSELRESWDKTNDVAGRTLLTQPGNTMKPLPQPSACINDVLSFGSDGLTPTCVANGGGGGGGDGWLNWSGEARLDADFSATSNTTLANVTGSSHNLTVNLQASRNYTFEIFLPMVTGASAGGIKIGLGGSATITNLIADGVCVDGTTEIAVTRVSTLTQMVANTNAGTTPKCKLSGTFEVNAAGTLTVQFAQNASSATASTVKRGAFMMVNDIP